MRGHKADALIEERVASATLVCTDGLGINCLGCKPLPPSQDPPTIGKEGSHNNRSENYWNLAKLHLWKFNSIKPEHFYSLVKVYQGRFNGGG